MGAQTVAQAASNQQDSALSDATGVATSERAGQSGAWSDVRTCRSVCERRQPWRRPWASALRRRAPKLLNPRWVARRSCPDANAASHASRDGARLQIAENCMKCKGFAQIRASNARVNPARRVAGKTAVWRLAPRAGRFGDAASARGAPAWRQIANRRAHPTIHKTQVGAPHAPPGRALRRLGLAPPPKTPVSRAPWGFGITGRRSRDR